ncbi:NTP transferase domain-containing protein [Paenibacillus sp. GCM10023252]|uniref:NTP transferase domain-containing protein n=1 Tax=Paenibacillus sp. GCM10023252 TaxID=3252649 RepID=UPI0036076E85
MKRSESERIAVVYLAAGFSKRMGRPKQSLAWPDGNGYLGGEALRAALRSQEMNRIYIVVRPDDELIWMPEQALLDDRCMVVPCSSAVEGLSSSLQAGVAAAEEAHAEAVVVILGDQPFIDSNHLDSLVRCWRQSLGLDYAASLDEDVMKPPVLLASSLYEAAYMLRGDEGARRLLGDGALRGAFVRAEPHFFYDVDTAEDWDKVCKWRDQGLVSGT